MGTHKEMCFLIYCGERVGGKEKGKRTGKVEICNVGRCYKVEGSDNEMCVLIYRKGMRESMGRKGRK